jgi:hypothetical protein
MPRCCEAEKPRRNDRDNNQGDDLVHGCLSTAQQFEPSHAVAKPSLFSTPCPGAVKPRKVPATTITTTTVMIFFMTYPFRSNFA